MNKVLSNSLIWLGAGISIAEIITGTYFAPLGLTKGIIAILLGHLIGCTLMFFTGFIGAREHKSSMECTSLSFGSWGAKFFACLNVVQLVGWTGIMIYDCVISVCSIVEWPFWIWCLIVGSLIILWLVLGLTNISKLNIFACSALFVLTIVLCIVIVKNKVAGGVSSALSEETLSFGAAMELAIAMPLSWLPLISDYTKESEKPFGITFGSTLSYFFISMWMYIIGLASALYTGESDVARIMIKAGLGIVALFIIILSTVTTTFLDAFSAGLSSVTVCPKINSKIAGIVVTVIGTVCAIFLPMDNITQFLYFIGAVFAPMTAILLADYFVLKNDASKKKFDFVRLVIWALGFAGYELMMVYVDIPCGSTIPVMAVVFILTVVCGKINKTKK